MYRVFIIWLAIGWCRAMVAPIRDEKAGSEQIHRLEESNQRTFVTPEVDDLQQTSYSSLTRGNQAIAKSSPYFYPVYPDYGNNGYTIQRGYENYLSSQATDPYSITEIATSLLFPVFGEIIVYAARVGTYLLQFLFVILLGGAFTTLICTFTSICTINFLSFDLTKNQVKEQVAELARTYVTTEAVNTATLLVSKALEKYKAMQNEKYESTKLMEIETPIK